MKKRFLSILLAACMVLTLMPATAFATDNVVADSGDSTLCEHHTQHDADCGYVLAQEAVEGTEEIPCNMACTDTDEDGEINHDDDCAYTPATEGTPTVAGTPCSFICEECVAEDNAPVPLTYEQVVELFEALPDADSITVDTTDEEQANITAQINAAMDAYDLLNDDDFDRFNNEQFELLQAADELSRALKPAKKTTYATYDIWVAGVQVTDANKDAITGDGISGTVTYDPVTSTLTLENATISGYSFYDTYNANCGIIGGYNTSLNLVLVGTNAVTQSGLLDQTSYPVAAKNLTIGGTGTLTATAGTTTSIVSCGIYAYTLVIKDSATVNAAGGKSTNASPYATSGGIQYNNSFTIQDHAVVTAVGGEAPRSRGFYCNGNGGPKMTGGTLTAIGNTVAMNDYALNLTGYTPAPTVTASTSADGSGSATYVPADFASYKYVKVVAPTATDLVVSTTVTDGVLTFTKAGEYSVAMQSGVITTSDRIAVNTPNSTDKVMLNLDGVRITAPGGEASQVGKDALAVTSSNTTLNITADSTLTGGVSGQGGQAGGGSGIKGSVTILGTAKLSAVGGDTINSGSRAGDGINGGTKVSGSVELEAVGGDSMENTANGGNGINGFLQVDGTATVSATGKQVWIPQTSYAAGVSGGITVGSGLIIKAGDTTPPTEVVASGSSSYKPYITVTSSHIHCICGGTTGIGDHTSHSDVSYTAVNNTGKFPGTADGNTNFYITAGSYYLTENIVLTEQQNIAAGTQVSICLNGHSISMTASGSIDLIFNNRGTLTICDCGTTGELRCAGGSAITTTRNGSTLFYGGKITGCNTGVIIKGESGGAGNFTMYGGEITGNSGDQIGGVQNKGSFTMYGGSVTNNSGSIAGGIANLGTLTIGGEVMISGNKVGTQDSNLVLVSTITVSAAQSSPIGVTILDINDVSSTTGVFTGVNSAAYFDSFKADDSRYFVALTNDNALELKAPVSAADYAADAASPTDYEINGTTLTIKTAKGAAWWDANHISYPSYSIKLDADIDISDFNWMPIGNDGNAFTGTFDGQGHRITGLTITQPNGCYVGLFGIVSGATIQNLCISGTIDVTNTDALYIGSLTGCMGGVNSCIRNCCSHVDIGGAVSNNTSEINIGGIVGWLDIGSIENSFNTGSVSASCAGTVIAGGIFGACSTYMNNIGTVENCYNTGSVSGSGGSPVLIGAMAGSAGNNITFDNSFYLYGVASTALGTGSRTGYSSVTADAACSLLSNLNGWVTAQESTDYCTWVADDATTPANGGYPVLSTAWTAPQAPVITAGANQSTPSSASSDLIVTSSANFADFQRVEVGKQDETPTTLAKANYTVASGSTVVTLKNSYLKTLSAATYTLNIVSATGTASTTFTITSGGGNNSNNGGGSSTAYYTITATAGAGGSISTGKSVSVREGDSAGFTMTPDKGYIIANVNVDGKSVGAVASYTFTNVRANHTIEVTFKVSGGHVNPQTGVAFEDVYENDWFYDAVYNTVENGWFAGTSNTTFAPNASATRDMIATVLHRMENEPIATTASGFEDVASGTYYFKGVNWAQEHKIVSGYGNGKFGPQDNITREQMAAILYRYAQFKGYDVIKTTGLDSFTDGATVSEYAAVPMKWAVATGLINGKSGGILDPRGYTTRAQIAAILTRFDELFSEE